MQFLIHIHKKDLFLLLTPTEVAFTNSQKWHSPTFIHQLSVVESYHANL